MSMTPEQVRRLFYLLGALRDEIITEEEFLELNALLDENSEAQEYYLDYIYLCTDLCNLQAAIKQDERLVDRRMEEEEAIDSPAPVLTLEMLRVLGDYERKAETLNVPKIHETDKPPLGKIPVKVPPRKISRVSILTFVSSLAALLFLIAYVHLVPRPSYEVATLLDSVNAEWSHFLPLQKGTRLSVSSAGPIELRKGVIEIISDKDVVITLEGPAAFRFISTDEISMQYGRLFATVPPAGSGFSVQTQNSKVIDLGTNFGIYADMRGETELHVFKGNTVLIAGQKGQNKKTVEVAGGQACRIDSGNSFITDIALNPNMFARGIDPETGLLITGGKHIDLSDIIGGGDGTGTGNPAQGIGWDGTKLISSSELPQNNTLSFPTGYVPVNWNPLIDGVFVPNSKGEEPLKLTSTVLALNLDAFIASDTNGQLTFILLNETTDINASYWFYAKESNPDDPAKFPTLTFPNASSRGPVKVTTAENNGADAYVSNDALRAPTTTPGKTSMLSCRYMKDKRTRIIFLRFDISEVRGNLRGAVMSLYLSFGNRYRNLQVYGLKDGPADYWDEKTISFNSAPGLLPAAYGNYQLDKNMFEFLGTFHVVDNRMSTDPIPVTANRQYLWNAPNTQRQSESVISNAPHYLDHNGLTHPLVLDNIPCGTDENPCIYVPANAGITFDLDAVRAAYGPVSIESFTATCGISTLDPASSTPNENEAPSPAASFYVLVNGEEVFSALDLSPQDAPQSIDLKIDRQAHYLTLAATQGTDNSILNDRCLFVKPTLILK
jgi:hypothetical protein